MKCYCGEIFIEHNETLHLHNNIIGNYDVSEANYYKCEACGELLFPKDTVKKIESVETEIKHKLISQLPVHDFIFATESADLLGISRQAFNKNHRIRNGFIYHITIGDKKLYNKKSLFLFKEKGDGRFNLSTHSTRENVRCVVIVNNLAPGNVQYIKGINSLMPKTAYNTTCQKYKLPENSSLQRADNGRKVSYAGSTYICV